jgi:rubrerythrin
MNLHTASEVISFAKELENESARFYQDLSLKYAKDEDVFLSFVKENGKNVIQIERAYYGVISDAIEGCFAFDISPDEYEFKTELPAKASYSDALERAVEIEGMMIRFYSDAAEQSNSLLADVPRVFKMVVKKREQREPKLRSLLGKEVQ